MRVRVFLLLAAGLGLLAVPAAGQERGDELLPVVAIVEAIEAEYFGRVIDVDLDDADEPDASYEVELRTPQGNVIEFEIDARTGLLMEIEGRGIAEARRP